MQISRTPLLMEFGPYGPSLRGTTGFNLPLSMGRFSTFPYNMDPCVERERMIAAERRRQRLQELAREWTVKCSSQKKNSDERKSKEPSPSARLLP